MPRLVLVGLCASTALVAFACNDELVEDVPKSVCYSEKRWIGGKRGSPEMYPGEDCVGCHRDNDGPPLAVGGTVYPYYYGSADQLAAAQSGEHCFGAEGINVRIEDNEGQVFDLVTNRAGNFFVEGNPDDFAKPFTVSLIGYSLQPDGEPVVTSMSRAPYYGGCAHCHNPFLEQPDEEFEPEDPDLRFVTARIGLFNYRPNGPDAPSVQEELDAIAEANDGEP